MAVLIILVATGCFHAVYIPATPTPLALVIVGYVFCLVQLARLPTTRQAFYLGLLTGFLCIAPQMAFMWTIFGTAAIPLWLILSLWIAFFVTLAHLALERLGAKLAVWLIPFLWTGLEYFRSELYYLKFSWLNAGYALSGIWWVPFHQIGIYGIGFAIAAIACFFIEKHSGKFWGAVAGLVMVLSLICGILQPATSNPIPKEAIHLGGIQLEFPSQVEILQSLTKLAAANTNLDVIVLSEYSLDDKPTPALTNWCRKHGKFLVVGGKDPTSGDNFYDTAFVIGTNGDVVFKQAKAVPIQFFKDGLPATEQRLWESPWGKIGICICYDLSYSRVTDALARQGAQALIVPTMDVTDWGRHEHELHARVAPVRAAEYGIPIFRVASSGISQGVAASGLTAASAPYPGSGETITYDMRISKKASLPLDRFLAPLCVAVTAFFMIWSALGTLKRKAP